MLLAEDDLVNQLVMTAKLHALSETDFTVDVVCTAELALERLTGAHCAYDLILMDQHFECAGGVMTGADAIRELRARGIDIPVIMCTANWDVEDKELYKKVGASKVWPKPCPAIEAMASDIYELLCCT